MKKRFLSLILAVTVFLSGCVIIGEDGFLEMQQDRAKYPEISGMFQLRDYVTQQRQAGSSRFLR